MRITADRNGDPFGYCEAECSQQLRIGGDARRVRKFIERHPWAAGKPAEPAQPAAVPVTATVPEPKPAAAPVPAPATAPKAKRAPVANPFDFLLNPNPKGAA